jgi:hypothetical protein
MENYIVRIYRRDAVDPGKIAGVFESVEQETEKNFTSLDSLMSLLASKPPAQESVPEAEHDRKRLHVKVTD